MNGEVCRAAAVALTGLEGTAVMVEAAVSQQLPGMAIIGLPDAALAEAKQRVRTASAQAGLPLAERFVIVNLAPASLPKYGSGFDLAIALAALAASQRIPPGRLADTAHIGELGLDGGLRRPAGLLSAVLAARELGFARVMVPEESGAEARLVPNIEIVEARNLAAAVDWHSGRPGEWSSGRGCAAPASPAPAAQGTPEAGSGSGTGPDLDSGPDSGSGSGSGLSPGSGSGPGIVDVADIVGQPDAVEAMAIAAAGRHHVSLVGPPGSGKTLLASALPSLLPDLTPGESLTASSIASLSGTRLLSLITRPPFESPHHSASPASIVGSGDSRGIRPGAISRACHGVLFLDEAPEFGRSVLDELRQPLESGRIDVIRARGRAKLPARFQLVLAANPCPCGNAGSADTALACTCAPSVRVRYLARISGPLADRIDIRLSVRRVRSLLLGAVSEDTPITSAQLRARVEAARARAAHRLSDTPWTVNGEVRGEWLRGDTMRLPRADTAVLDRALARGALTVRGYDRTLRVAWTIADLSGKERPCREDLARALSLRGGTL